MFIESSTWSIEIISWEEQIRQVLQCVPYGLLPLLIACFLGVSSILTCVSKKKNLSQSMVQPPPLPTFQPASSPRKPAGQKSTERALKISSKKRASKKGSRAADDARSVANEVQELDKSVLSMPFEVSTVKGNLDSMLPARKAQWEKELEMLRSKHEMEETSTDTMSGVRKHVKIEPKKCRLYETNDVLTAETRQSSDDSAHGSVSGDLAVQGNGEKKEGENKNKSSKPLKISEEKQAEPAAVEDAKSEQSEAAASANEEKSVEGTSAVLPAPTTASKPVTPTAPATASAPPAASVPVSPKSQVAPVSENLKISEKAFGPAADEKSYFYQ